jgi:hypothetical protein
VITHINVAGLITVGAAVSQAGDRPAMLLLFI